MRWGESRERTREGRGEGDIEKRLVSVFILDTVCLIGNCEQLIYEVLVQNIAETDPLHV